MVLPQKCSLFFDEATLVLPWNGLCLQNVTLQHTNSQIKENKLEKLLSHF